ncbi:MAG: efflux RND transporter periplasmic adaptor subunit [Neisseria sp.]|nr:efflux RND transporter periplasmic adaptor subunit [Neisseria sp.]
MMKNTWKAVVVLFVAAVSGVLLWKWFEPAEQSSYMTQTVARGDIVQTVSATGELTASHWVEVGAQASGQIKKLYVGLGQEVRKGDLIAEIDAQAQTNALNTHKAKLDTYRAQLASARIVLSSAQKKWRRESLLLAEGATSAQDVDNAQDNAAAAQARVRELESLIRQSRISIQTAQTDLAYTRILAPISGTVVSVAVEEGRTVNANQAAPTIVQIADLSEMLNKIQIAEGDLTKIAVGSPVSFTILSEPDVPLQTALDSIDPGLIALSRNSYGKNSDSGETAVYYYARAYVPNPDRKLAIGMTTQNTLETGSVRNVLTVPVSAVVRRGGKSSVRVLRADGTIEIREVLTGMRDDSNIEIRSGLSEGEQVVVSEAAAESRSPSRRRGMFGM